MTRAHLDKRPADVAAMFDGVARRYDLLNDVLSVGQDRMWRRAVARILGALGGERVLDLAAGTGTSSRFFTRSGATCVACDFSLGMLREGLRRSTGSPAPPGVSGDAGRIGFVAGDALCLPFADQAFDAVTISFGLRNVADTKLALTEMARVTRQGGRLVVCEFSHIPVRPVNAAYEVYLTRVLPSVARFLVRSGAAYDYLAESIRDWPSQPDLADLIRAAGWSAVRWRNLSLGVVAVHVGRKE